MSEVRTNSITDAAGTGAPDFPNGIEVADGQSILIGIDSGDPFNPNSKIRVQGAGDEWIQIKSDGTGTVGLLLGDTTDDFTAGIQSNQADGANLLFYAGNAVRMEIDSTGYVGIGTTTPNVPLDVEGAGTDVVGRFYRTDSTLAVLRVGNSTTGDGGTAPEFGADGTSAVIRNNNAECMRIDSAGTLQFNSGYGSVATAFGCRAWVNFNGTGTVAIRASGNVSSITDLGTGAYRVNLATAMPDANYAVATSGEGYTLGDAGALQGPTTYSLSTSSFSLACGSNTNSRGGDWPTVSAAVFR